MYNSNNLLFVEPDQGRS